MPLIFTRVACGGIWRKSGGMVRRLKRDKQIHGQTDKWTNRHMEGKTLQCDVPGEHCDTPTTNNPSVAGTHAQKVADTTGTGTKA